MQQGFPGQHTTTTTATTSHSTPTNLRFDPSYARTFQGMLKAGQIVLNLLGFICIVVSRVSSHGPGGWFNTVAMLGFWCTGILLAFYLFHVVEKFCKIPWLKIEFIYCVVMTVFYLLAASLAADFARVSQSFGAAAFFGFCAMVAYGYDAWLKFTAARAGLSPQGQHPSSKPVSTVGSPAY